MNKHKDKIVRFQGMELLLVGGDLEKGGALTTPEAFRNFDVSYAHLCADGKVMRFGDTIGHRDEISVVREITADEPDLLTALDKIAGEWDQRSPFDRTLDIMSGKATRGA